MNMDNTCKADIEKELKALNPVGKRIKWCRETLGLSKYKVAKDNGIVQSTYCERENGMRAISHEEYLILAMYFDELWKKKFEKMCASYEGNPVCRIKVQWIMFGISED